MPRARPDRRSGSCALGRWLFRLGACRALPDLCSGATWGGDVCTSSTCVAVAVVARIGAVCEAPHGEHWVEAAGQARPRAAVLLKQVSCISVRVNDRQSWNRTKT